MLGVPTKDKDTGKYYIERFYQDGSCMEREEGVGDYIRGPDGSYVGIILTGKGHERGIAKLLIEEAKKRNATSNKDAPEIGKSFIHTMEDGSQLEHVLTPNGWEFVREIKAKKRKRDDN